MSGTPNAPTGWQRENQYPAFQRLPLGPGHRALGRALIALLACCGAVSLAKVMMDLYGMALFAGGTADPRTIVAANGIDLAAIDLMLVGLRGLAVLATAIATMTWLYQAYGSREADPALLRHEQWWAIGGWLVPFICFRRPLQLMRNLYIATAGRPGLQVKCPSYFTWWWLCFLIGNALANPFKTAGPHPSMSARQNLITLDLIGQILLIAAGGLFVAVLGSITSQMERCSSESTATARNTSVR